MKHSEFRSSLLLLLAALFWGSSFVAQKEGLNLVGTFTFNFVRFTLAGLCLWLVLPVLDRFRAKDPAFQRGNTKDILLGGFFCGLALCVASNVQQLGISWQDPATNVGKAGFITACYCAFVPVLQLFFHRRPPVLVWVGVAVAVVGFFFLCLMDGLTAGLGLRLERSDLVLLASAVCFAVHILLVGHFSPLADGVRISCVQFFTAGLVSAPGMALFEQPSLEAITACWLPICYAGIVSAAVGFTLQVVAQKHVHPAVASLLMSMESVFSVLAGYLLIPGSSLTRWEILGCVLVFAAVVIVQLAPLAKQLVFSKTDRTS